MDIERIPSLSNLREEVLDALADPIAYAKRAAALEVERKEYEAFAALNEGVGGPNATAPSSPALPKVSNDAKNVVETAVDVPLADVPPVETLPPSDGEARVNDPSEVEPDEG